ncbi:unnamed protein product [Peniophora sp. CBMAI 1063]|nr:unnamed protein product [Peniophora sp. CBMAI 1063]
MPPDSKRAPVVTYVIDSDGDVSTSYSDCFTDVDEVTLDEMDMLPHLGALPTAMTTTSSTSGGFEAAISGAGVKSGTQSPHKNPLKKRPRVIYDSEDELDSPPSDTVLPRYALPSPRASPVKPSAKSRRKASTRTNTSRSSSASTSRTSNVTTPIFSDDDDKSRYKTPVKKRPRVVYDSEDEQSTDTPGEVLPSLRDLLSPKADSSKPSSGEKGKGKAPATTWTLFPLKTTPSTSRTSSASSIPSPDVEAPRAPAKSLPTPAPSPTKPSRAKIRSLVAASRSLDYMDVDIQPAVTTLEDDPHAPAPFYIAQPPTEILGDVRKLAWATQWELSRLVTEGKLDWNSSAFQKKLAAGQLQGGAVDVARCVADIILGQNPHAPASTKEYVVRAPWVELDREAAALGIATYGCMGTMNDAIDGLPESWYGGNVHYAAKLTPGASDNDPPTLTLLRPERHSSSLFARRFGSDSYIRLRIAPDLLGEPEKFTRIARGLLLRPFVICGRTYEVRYTNRDGVAFLMASSTTTPRGLPGCEGQRFMSFHKFFQWFNPIQLNSDQYMAKYCARVALGFSNSVPGGVLEPENVRTAPDIVSEDGELFTDGCGFTTLFTLESIQKRLGWPSMPTAIQLRTFGSKGIVHLHPDAEPHLRKELAVYLRPSQVKIHRTLAPNLDPAHLEISVLRPGRMNASVKISQDIVVCLAENGVPTAVFEKRLRQQFSDVVSCLLDWPRKCEAGQPSDMVRLWAEVERTGNVVASRHARQSSGSARARGFVLEDCGEVDDEDYLDAGSQGRDISIERSLAWWPDDLSGMPSALDETALDMIQAGFRPDQNAVLAHKLKHVIISLVKTMSRALKVKLQVPMSASAWIAPDPHGVLEEGEIFFKSSKHNVLLPDGRYSDTFVGWVLVVRDPCKLPSDVQKVRAVFREELRDYHDQIIFSTKGKQALASLLAGGDYDGDRAVVIWDPEMVVPFCNADAMYATPPAALDKAFNKDPLKVSEFVVKHPSLDGGRMRAMQQVIFMPLKDVYAPGLYSNMHANSAYVNGFNHPLTIAAGWKFCLTLDGAKSGMSIKDATFAADKKSYASHRNPRWKHQLDPDASKFPPLTRRKDLKLSTFVLDTLFGVVATEEKAQLDIVYKKFDSLTPFFELDPVLCAPARQELEACKAAETRGHAQPLEEFKRLEKHVQDARQALNNVKREAQSRHKVQSFTGLPIRVRQDVLRSGSRQFSSYPEIDHPRYEWLCRVRASIAYSREHSLYSQYPYEVAMRDLCKMKAESQGGGKPMTAEFADVMKIWKGVLP